jgi:hypothetical protein
MGWLSWFRGMGGSLATAAFWVQIQTSLKNHKNGLYKQGIGQHNLSGPQNKNNGNNNK